MSGWQREDRARVTVLRMDDARVNALTIEGLAELNLLLDQAEGSGAVVICGRADYFCAGFDLPTIRAGGEPRVELVRAGALTLARLCQYRRPVVAACTGHALAAGALLLLACDRRVGAAGEFRIGLNETAIGMGVPRFLVELARYRIPQPALEDVLWGEVHDPPSAIRAGYLDEVVEPEQTLTRAVAVANRLAQLPGDAVSWSKRELRTPVAEAIRSAIVADVELLRTLDRRAPRPPQD
jgi:enoyl-CoA hydratase